MDSGSLRTLRTVGLTVAATFATLLLLGALFPSETSPSSCGNDAGTPYCEGFREGLETGRGVTRTALSIWFSIFGGAGLAVAAVAHFRLSKGPSRAPPL